ncbi:MAG: GC-type dockerin domain-anchored protein [Phycisphaerales bacterium]
MRLSLPAAVVFACGLSVAHADPVRLSHSLEPDLIQRDAGVSCASTSGPLTTFDNQFWREFELAFFGISGELRVTAVEIGIDRLELPAGLQLPIDVLLYQAPGGAAPRSGFPVVGTARLNVASASLEVVTVDIDAVVDAGSTLIVEYRVPDFDAVGLLGSVFFPGANTLGETAPSYLSASRCDTPEPVTFASIGFPDSALVINVLGDVDGACVADLDGDGELTLFDFLTFQNLFDAGDPAADFDGDGSLTLFDFLSFQNSFDAGCP